MSASLASARMNSRQPGSAWIAASLRSSDLAIASPAPCPEIVTRDCRRPPFPPPGPSSPGPDARSAGLGDGAGGPSGLGALPAALGFLFKTSSIVSRRTWAECWSAETSLGQSSISSWASTPFRPTTVGIDMQTSRIPYVAIDQRGDRQDPLLVERHGVDDLADRQADGEARPPLELDHLGAAAAGPCEQGLGGGGVPARELLERQAGGLGGRPDRHHAVAVLAEDQGRDLSRRELESLGDQAAEPGRVELRCPGR